MSITRHYEYIRKNLTFAIGVLLIVAGLLTIGSGVVASWLAERDVHAQSLVSNQSVYSSAPLISGTPTHITIPSINISLNVINGYYNSVNKSWTLTDSNAQWGAMTVKPNNKEGDTFIYAHALMNLFGRLPNIRPGDEATVTTSNGHTFVYKYERNIVTSPTDTSLFTYKGRPILVLQTCSGFWYQYRQLFILNLVKTS